MRALNEKVDMSVHSTAMTAAQPILGDTFGEPLSHIDGDTVTSISEGRIVEDAADQRSIDQGLAVVGLATITVSTEELATGAVGNTFKRISTNESWTVISVQPMAGANEFICKRSEQGERSRTGYRMTTL